MPAKCITAAAVLIGLTAATPPAPSPVLWAWERPEDLRFAGPGVVVAVLAGTIRLSGDDVFAQPRLQPALVLPSQQTIGVVHVEIDRGKTLTWTAAQRQRATTAALGLLRNPRFGEVQIDFEVPASQRHVLLDLLTDVRAGLQPGRRMSMTALASWCDTETWIVTAPVDEIVPMMFRMGQTGQPIRQRLASGGDFREPRCRTSIGVATDTPPDKLPRGRRIWMFNPRPWTQIDLTTLTDRLGT